LPKKVGKFFLVDLNRLLTENIDKLAQYAQKRVDNDVHNVN
jgi:hypothetical protein